MKPKPIFTDNSGTYPIYLYSPVAKGYIPSIDKEVHISLTPFPEGTCLHCECDNCPLWDDNSPYTCCHLNLFVTRYPLLLKDYPEYFL